MLRAINSCKLLSQQALQVGQHQIHLCPSMQHLRFSVSLHRGARVRLDICHEHLGREGVLGEVRVPVHDAVRLQHRPTVLLLRNERQVRGCLRHADECYLHGRAYMPAWSVWMRAALLGQVLNVD